MFKARILTIPHSRQIYDTVGDWSVDKSSLTVSVSNMSNPDYEFLVAIHELIEAYLCLTAGISDREVTEFDEGYEKARYDGTRALCGCLPTEISEPGKDEHAPYKNEHEFATKIEKMLAKKLGVNWRKYDDVVNSL